MSQETTGAGTTGPAAVTARLTAAPDGAAVRGGAAAVAPAAGAAPVLAPAECPGDAAPCGGRRGRPRSEAVERAIFDAAVGMLEHGVPLADLSIEKLARTAGVGKATIYRRWPGKEALLIDLLRSLELPEPDLPGTSARDDLVTLLESLRQRGMVKRSNALLHNVFSQMQMYPKLWDAYQRTVIEPRRRMSLDAIRRGMANGEIRPDLDVELVNDLVTGPLLLRSVIRPDSPLEPGLAEQIVDTVLEGVRPAV
ncbi:TetR/AcrR family transcriptional regulator [Streptomyces laurentii]|uniref:TetR/AcrR family transcriptional regulator n=1 Tax=Streptomyces laurentii TaxID=39478 RepID=UPI00367E9FCA